MPRGSLTTPAVMSSGEGLGSGDHPHVSIGAAKGESSDA